MAHPSRTPDVLAVSDLDFARATILTESDGLRALANVLDGAFVAAVDTIHTMRVAKKGRLIVSGVGKSGHVARKMVATFSSTGVPSHYVHPSEASHGDLGMITENDVVILISNSGESSEQGDMIAYTRRFDIPLIAITRKPKSTLGTSADTVICLPDIAEAFSDVVAPTTSAINTMAIGDALAECLMKRVGLTPEQFKVFHPGGKLGAQLLKVSDIMISGTDVPYVDIGSTMDAAIVEMTAKNVGCVLVVDESQKLHGIITDGDLKRHMAPDLLVRAVTDVMGKNPQTITPNAWAAEALHRMVDRENGHIITSLVVVENNMAVGLIRVQETLRAGLA